jgi:MFS family permease
VRIEHNLKLIALFTICTDLIFLVPVVLPYYRDVIGLGYREFLFGEAAFAAAIVLFDVPTGWISDVWRRKHTLTLSVIINMTGWITLLFVHTLWGVILVQVLLGIGYSLSSGTSTALLYDSLLSVGHENDYSRLEGKRLALLLYAVAAASVAGGFLYSIHHALPIWLTLLAYSIAFITTLNFDEPERHKLASNKNPLADIINAIKYVMHGHADIGFFIMFSATLFCSTKLLMWSQQPYYMALNYPEAIFGILMAIGYGLGGASSHFAHLFDGKVNTFKALIYAWGIALAVAIGAAIHLGVSGVGLLMIGGSCIYGATSPRVSEAITQAVGSERRATILSTQSFLTNFLAIPISILTGFASGTGGVQLSLFTIAIWLCLAGVCLAAWRIKQKR